MRVEEGEDVMTTMVAVTIAAHIGRRSELGAGDGMMFRLCLIRADEAHDRAHHEATARHASSPTRDSRDLRRVAAPCDRVRPARSGSRPRSRWYGRRRNGELARTPRRAGCLHP